MAAFELKEYVRASGPQRPEAGATRPASSTPSRTPGSEHGPLRPADLRPGQNELSIKAHGELEPKTKKSARTIPVTEETMDQLLALANEVGPFDDLFPCPVKCRYHFWRHRFDEAKKADGLRHFTFHDLRRAAADRLRSTGLPVDRYCRLMGHAAVTGIRHYENTDPDDLHRDLRKGLKNVRSRRRKLAADEVEELNSRCVYFDWLAS